MKQRISIFSILSCFIFYPIYTLIFSIFNKNGTKRKSKLCLFILSSFLFAQIFPFWMSFLNLTHAPIRLLLYQPKHKRNNQVCTSCTRKENPLGLYNICGWIKNKIKKNYNTFVSLQYYLYTYFIFLFYFKFSLNFGWFFTFLQVFNSYLNGYGHNDIIWAKCFEGSWIIKPDLAV